MDFLFTVSSLDRTTTKTYHEKFDRIFVQLHHKVRRINRGLSFFSLKKESIIGFKNFKQLFTLMFE